MITEYHRPHTLEDALALLARPAPRTLPLGGGTLLNAPSAEAVAVVDLQNLGLDTANVRGLTLEAGAALTLQALLEMDEIQPALRAAIRHEATANLRQAATVAGSLVAAGGRSPFATAMLALDARLTLLPGETGLDLGGLFAIRETGLAGKLITRASFSLKASLAYEYVARTPADLPIVGVAVARWPSGRVRIAVGGWGRSPRLALDGPEPGGEQAAVASACAEAGDEWATAEYRREVAVVLVSRIENRESRIEN